jgi:hypothetical protein
LIDTGLDSRLNAVMDKALSYFAGSKFEEEVKIAKSEFFDNAGILEEGSNQYELRMSQFFDWYFYTRDLIGYSQTPVEVINMVRELRFNDDELKLIDCMRKHRHSMFEFIKIKGSDIYIRDIIKGDKIWIKNSQWAEGFDTTEIFEVRIIPVQDNFVFTRGFCFHPEEARKFILAEVKKYKKDPDLDPDLLMLKLLKMRYKFERYRHVDIDLIYSEQSKI